MNLKFPKVLVPPSIQKSLDPGILFWSSRIVRKQKAICPQNWLSNVRDFDILGPSDSWETKRDVFDNFAGHGNVLYEILAKTMQMSNGGFKSRVF